ncbi:MAG TPA: endopeptidase La [Spirochaetia bacterium]|nr:endopeptidase La [Spirochaetia bacterium]
MTNPFRSKNAEKHESLPEELPILPLRNTVPFPFIMIPLTVGIPRSVKLVEDSLKGDSLIGLVASKDASVEEPAPEQVHTVGIVGKILRAARSQDGTMQIVVQGLERIRVTQWLDPEPYMKARIEAVPEKTESDLELEGLVQGLRSMAQEVIDLSPTIPREAAGVLNAVSDPRYLIYLVAGNAQLEPAEAQRILAMDSVKEKLRTIIAHLAHQKEVLSLGQKIRTEAKEEMEKEQREYILRQQLKAIQKELGDMDENQSIVTEYSAKIEKTGMPEEAKKEAQRELKRLSSMPSQAAEYSMIKTYLDWMVELPWSSASEDQLDITNARRVLDEDHYDLQEVKDRIIEFLAVRKLFKERGIRKDRSDDDRTGRAMGAILCFVGPPGVGKTSLGQSIARALGRKFTRMSLGGMRDEAEIRGHRRTYIGSMPGRIMQAIKRAGTRNPVFMLDEIDKVGSDWRGDPSSALLEVLDPAQNGTFRDHYLNVDFDLSDVMFVTTANQLEPIPAPLRDRMEIIQLDGYTEHEKVKIAQGHLVKRQLAANGLREGEVVFTEEALRKIVQDYTREAGVRTLERQIGAICRKSVTRIASGTTAAVEITPEVVRELLRREKFDSENSETIEIPGIATGLAVTPVGGDILFIEATRMKGKGDFTLTGQLGDVMRESARIAHSYVRSKAAELSVDPEVFAQMDVHVHVPAGAIPKDGPSAGVAMTMAIASLFTGRPVRGDVGMTGEVTLRGRVLPIGGVKMKVLAAHRAGLTTVILPKRNERDLEDLPEDVRTKMRFVLVDRIDEALAVGLTPRSSQAPTEKLIA